MIKSKINFYYRLLVEKSLLKNATIIAIIVGFIINFVNNPTIYKSTFAELHLAQMILTFFIPFFVYIFSSLHSQAKLKPGNISHIDAILKCKSCSKEDFHIHIGQQIEECPMCKKRTRWKLLQIFSFVRTENEMLKSLALFARHNPQPLFRINEKGIIVASNPASELLFEKENFIYQEITKLIPELKQFDFTEIIKNESEKKIVFAISNKFFNLMLKGVSSLNTIHIYGNDITQIVLAEQKIKQQAQSINESIQYAWIIQKSMLPHDTFFKNIFPKNFIFYRPLNVVSGDFYWVNQIGHLKILAVADCTGHGVPGAFMSMIGISIINEIILRENIYEPDKILNRLRERIISSLSSGDNNYKLSDGMDIALIVIDTRDYSLSFSGAYNPLYILREGELIITKADRMPVGKFVNDNISFNKNKSLIKPKDRIFMFTDGYKDQWGGERGKKFNAKAFRKLITDLSNYPFEKQFDIISKTFDDWKLDNEQVDDVLVVGIELQ